MNPCKPLTESKFFPCLETYRKKMYGKSVKTFQVIHSSVVRYLKPALRRKRSWFCFSGLAFILKKRRTF